MKSDERGIMNLVFDIGGVILDDTDELLWRVLGVDGADMADERNELEHIFYDDARWGKVMRGQMALSDYLDALKKEHPKLNRELEMTFGQESRENVLPIDQKNVSFLEKLHRQAKYKMFWLSNMDDGEYKYLRERGILGLLDGGVYSCVEHCKKPEPEFYQRLFERYNLKPEECLFFDDLERNLQAGRELGMKGVLVSNLKDLEKIVGKALDELDQAR